jgi:hypothetical protein
MDTTGQVVGKTMLGENEHWEIQENYSATFIKNLWNILFSSINPFLGIQENNQKFKQTFFSNLFIICNRRHLETIWMFTNLNTSYYIVF